MTMWEVYKAIEANGGTATILEICKLTNSGRSSVEEVLSRMKKAGYIRRVKLGVYALGEVAPVRNAYVIKKDGTIVQVVE